MAPRAVRAPHALALTALACALTSLALPAAGAADHQLRVLFIGNSYTRFNDLPRMVEQIAESVPGGPRVMAQRETHGGYDLRAHWEIPRVRRRVGSGRWDLVVLQPHSLAAIDRLEELREYARRFQSRATAAGSRVVLFQTWARHPESRDYRELAVRDPVEMESRLQEVYRQLGQELGTPVAPVGDAWERARASGIAERLHRGDHGTHPAVAGTYLSACVLYGTLTGIDPREVRWRHWRLSRRDAEAIRAVAADSLGPGASAPHAWPAAAPTATPLR